MRTYFTDFDLFSGLAMALEDSGVNVLDHAYGAIPRILPEVFPRVEEYAEKKDLFLNFRIKADPLHGTSEKAGDFMYTVMKMRFATFDSPGHKMRIDVGDFRSPFYLRHKDFFEELATNFMEEYEKYLSQKS